RIREVSRELRASASAGGAGKKNSFTANPTKISATIAKTYGTSGLTDPTMMLLVIRPCIHRLTNVRFHADIVTSENARSGHVVGSHGRFVWYELITTDVAAAKAFYTKVIGWDAWDAPPPGSPY